MRISTIIPAYNRADLIGETLRTILSQSRPPHEVIVVDDGSTDGTQDAVTAFGKDVTLICQANAGAGPARNAGFARSSGNIIHFMDSDDLCSLNFYEAAAKRIEAGADMTYGPWLKTRIEGNRLDPEPVVHQQGPVPPGTPIDVLALLVDWVTVFQPCMFRRDLIERAGPYRHDLRSGQDTEVLYRIMAAARHVQHMPETLILNRWHPEDQLSEQDLSKRLVYRAHLWSIMQKHLDKRTDLKWTEKRTFRIKKYHVATEAMPYDPAEAKALMSDVRFADRLSSALRRLLHRIRMRIQVMMTGNPYPATLAAAPILDDQRKLIRQLGYALGSTK